MKSALALVLLAATTASIGCGGAGAAFVPASKPPVVVCTPPNMLVGGVCTTPTPAPTALLSANPGTISKGGSTTLTWQTSNATDVSIDGVGVQLNGSESVTPTDSTTYTLTAKGAGGTQMATAMVTVTTPPPIPVVPAKHYQVVDLAPLPGDVAAQAQATANGRVVGWSIVNMVSRAVLWEGGTVRSLGLGVAYALNNLGEAAGYSPQGNNIFHATLWNHDGTTSDLLTLPGFDSSLASGISDSGEVVGVSFSSQNLANQAAFRWTASTGIQAIQGAASVSGENSNGDIAGMTTDSRAAIFTAAGETINLGTFGDFSIAISVSNQRHAAGYSSLTHGGPVHAFFYNTNLQDLGSLQTGDDMVATSLNDSDLVVGQSNLNGHALAWVWSATTGTEDLNTLIPANSGWVLTGASSVDQNGNIVGAGVIGGVVHGYMLTPN